MRLFINCKSNLLEYKIDFIDDQKYIFNRMPEHLSCVPTQLSSGDCIQKTAFFSMSEAAAKNLCIKINGSVTASMNVFDVQNHSYQNMFVPMQLRFTDDLLKKWRY